MAKDQLDLKKREGHSAVLYDGEVLLLTEDREEALRAAANLNGTELRVVRKGQLVEE